MADHHQFVQEAVNLAREGMRTNRGGPFGAVIVRDGTIVGRGCNQVTSTLDPTAHAEMVAIREACLTVGRFDLCGCVIYASCEPCPMCLSAIHWARIDKIYYACTRYDAAGIGFDDNHIYQQVALPLEQRSLPIEHLPTQEATDVFQEWKSMPGKIHY
jgi:tRNA(Arg) A34 adenosine deaminase TadA